MNSGPVVNEDKIEEYFYNFLKTLEMYKLKQIPRDSSNHYYDEKDKVFIKRRETTGEHVYSSLKLADYFLTTEKEFSRLDKLAIYEILLYHDDVEGVARDTGISKREERKSKTQKELEALIVLNKTYPIILNEKVVTIDTKYRSKSTEIAKFAGAIDKMDSLMHELQYPEDWGPKGFDEKNVRAWFQSAFEYSPTFMKYFETMISYLNKNGYFEKELVIVNVPDENKFIGKFQYYNGRAHLFPNYHPEQHMKKN